MRYVESVDEIWPSWPTLCLWARWFTRHAWAVCLGFVVPMLVGTGLFFFGEMRGAADAYADAYIEGCRVVAYETLCADAARLSRLERERGSLLAAKGQDMAETEAICRRVTLLTGTGDDLSRTAARIAARFQCVIKGKDVKR